jgi:tight adherence protein C
MTATPVLGVGLGLVVALGLALVVLYAPPMRRPRLDDRLAPYLRDAPRPSRLLAQSDTLTPFPTLERLLRPVLADSMRLLERWLGGAASLRRRLVQAGRGMTLEEFRAEQVVWGALGLLGGLAVVTLSVATGTGPPPLALVVLCVVLTVLGVLMRDRWLTREVARREERMVAEFPTIAELLALAVTAGEGPVGALERVCRISTGELSKELRVALGEARTGASLVQAMEGIANRTSLTPLARFVDGVAIAVERGTPLAEVLRAQAADVREAGKRALLESGGKREIGMLVPVVFLVLPVTIVFALFPGFYGLQVIAR